MTVLGFVRHVNNALSVKLNKLSHLQFGLLFFVFGGAPVVVALAMTTSSLIPSVVAAGIFTVGFVVYAVWLRFVGLK